VGTGDVTKKLTLHDLQLSGEDGQPILIRAVAPDVNFGRVLEVLRAAQCSMLTNGSPVSFTSPVHGAHSKYFHKISGINSRLDSLQAAVHRVKLPRLDEWHARRGENAAHYPLGLHMQQCYSHLVYSEGAFPETEATGRDGEAKIVL